MMKMTGKDMEERMEQYQNALSDMSNEAVEYVRGVPVVKTFGQTIFSFKRFKAAIDNYETWVIAYTKALRLPMMFYTTAINGVFAFLIAGGILFTRDGVTNELLLNLIFYIVITPVIGTTLTKIMFMSEDAMIVGDALGRIDEVLNEKPLSESTVNNTPKDNGITLEHVSYSYDGEKNALNDVSLRVAPGQVIALVGASGGGKSEMLEDFHREDDDRLLIGTHTVTGEKYYMTLGESCKIHPIADDMACALKSIQDPTSGKLRILDAENGWFLRMDGMNAYGNNPLYERICIHPSEPLVFFNMDGIPGSTCLIWEHVIESNGKPCSNPRVILPRKMLDNIVPDTEPVEVDVRSFGVRMPPSTAKNPNYGVMGMLQVVPQSIAWLWRLVSPRGFKNPSIADTNAGSGLKAEGVGSYWPFATGLKVTQANLLLEQIMNSPNTTNVLIPNQHIGAYHVGFMGEWLSREYLARHLGTVRAKHLVPARCALFGYALDEMKLDGQFVRQTFLRPETQSKLGTEGYDAGAKILADFIKEQVAQFVCDDLDPLGKEIIDCCLHDGTLDDYLALTPMKLK